jgi:8-amino-7-oxononanoate synthase
MGNRDLEPRVRARLEDLANTQLLRTLQAPSGKDFSSNDYLGLAASKQLHDAMILGVQQEGCGSTGSRLIRGEREAFQSVESHFAKFKETERALYFSSGYLANLAVLTTFPEDGDIVFSDELNHASLIDGTRLSYADCVIFPHNDVSALSRLMHQHRGEGRIFVLVESIFSMDGDEAPLAEYAQLCRDQDACLMVDEAHAVGIYGERGSGLIEELGIQADVFLSVNPAGKALGVSGAFVAGPDWAIEYLVQKARTFIFSTASLPATAWALEASLTYVTSGIEIRNGRSQIVPIIIGSNERAVAVASLLQARGFDIRAIRPPTVAPGTARLRITVNAGISDETIDSFVLALVDALKN